MRPILRIAAAAVGAVVATTAVAAAEPAAAGVRPSPVLAWNRVALDAVERARPTQHQVVRLLAYLSLAQHATATARPGDADAIAAASATVIATLLPAQAAWVDARRREVARDDTGPEGAAIAARTLERAALDGFDRPWTGTVPQDPLAWRSLAKPPAAPAYPAIGAMRTFVLASGDALRADAPPRPGSPRFERDLDEVRRRLAAAAPEGVRRAKFYDMTTGTMAGGFWNEQAAAALARSPVADRDAARVLATLNMAMMDALVACHDSKYAYWVPRPGQVDPALAAIIGVPNHPSYPSNHSCLSTAAAHVLAHFVPAERGRLERAAAEAGESRIDAGIHYRFDVEAGERIGRAVAAAATAAPDAAIERFAGARLADRR